jgi:hypothetical protein
MDKGKPSKSSGKKALWRNSRPFPKQVKDQGLGRPEEFQKDGNAGITRGSTCRRASEEHERQDAGEASVSQLVPRDDEEQKGKIGLAGRVFMPGYMDHTPESGGGGTAARWMITWFWSQSEREWPMIGATGSSDVKLTR